jgi:prepilin-type N-terminal cleavage/methylation domain-containing protein
MTSTRLTKKLKKAQQGFTLIELLVVIGILAVLLSIVLIAINPARQFAQANNTQRASNVNAILNAIHEYAADNHGNLPAGIDTTVRRMTNTAGAANVDICASLVTKYLAAMPVDPKNGSYTDCTTYDTDYTVVSSAQDNRVTVSAPTIESPAVTAISVTR